MTAGCYSQATVYCADMVTASTMQSMRALRTSSVQVVCERTCKVLDSSWHRGWHQVIGSKNGAMHAGQQRCCGIADAVCVAIRSMLFKALFWGQAALGCGG